MALTHQAHLRALEAAGLIRLAATQPELEYTFRHALLQEAAYHTLSKFARASTHRAVAEALEAVYADGGPRDAHLGDLAFHYAQAGQWDQVLHYARRAGEREQAMYAPREALAHFDRAVEAARRLGTPAPWPLLRARGQAHETLGQLELARADHERALAQARAAGDQASEWQSLLDLGQLWAALDYVQAGACFRAALDRARAMGDRACLGHSLNRLGNWHVNNEEPQIARQHHQEALEIFEALGDTQSVAQTLDLLGITALLTGDAYAASRYYPRAIALFQHLGDRPGLINSQSIYLLRTLSYETDLLPSIDVSLPDLQQEGEASLALARGIGWRAAEAFVLHALSIALGPRGTYGPALAAAKDSLRIAQEIQHRQWTTASHYTLGMFYLDVLALPLAQQHLEAALDLARQTNSLIWMRLASGSLARTLLAQHSAETPASAAPTWHRQPLAQWPPRLARARQVLDLAYNDETPLRTIAEGSVWHGRAQLALATGEPARALEIAEMFRARGLALLEIARPVPVISLLRAQALAGLGRSAEAIAELEAAQARARAQGAPPILWRLLLALSRLHHAQGQPKAAHTAHAEAQAIIDSLAQKLPPGELRDNFLAQTQLMQFMYM